jgi:Tfp pilus assembly protein PilO
VKLFSKNSNYDKYYKDLVPYFKKEQNQRYLFIILTLGASIFFFLFAINPTLSTIAGLKKQISDAKFVEQRLSEKVDNISRLSLQYEQIQEDIPYIIDAVPQSPQTPTLVGQIQTIGNESSVKITNVEVLPVILTSGNSTTSSSFAFDITGTSNFENIQNFLNKLINMQRAVSISSIQILRDTTGDNSLNFVIRGVAYFKK